jgi:CheY-like chemotaxis protein
LKYNILWFDDKEDYIETHEPTLRSYLKEFGFELVVTPRIDDENLEEILKSSQADLILMDYRLSKSDDDNDYSDDTALTGDTVVTRIRDCDLYVETVLYSRDPTFPTNITAKLEGVFFATHTELLEKAKKVISLTIKKQQEISNIRGLFIAEQSTSQQKWKN